MLFKLAFSPAYGRLKSYSLKAAHQNVITMEAFLKAYCLHQRCYPKKVFQIYMFILCMHKHLFLVIDYTPYQRLSYIEGRLTSKVVIHQRSSSIKGRLPSKVVFRQRLSSVKGCLQSKVVFSQRSSSFKVRLPSKVIFHQRSSSIKGRLP